MRGVDTARGRPLKVTVTGGGPVGLTFALLLESLMSGEVSVAVHDARWTEENGRIVWKGEKQQNARRHQVVTIQSRQYLRLPRDVRERVFQEGHYTEMWPQGPDSISGCGPRNIRIAHFEDQLLALANEKTGRVQLIAMRWSSARAPILRRETTSRGSSEVATSRCIRWMATTSTMSSWASASNPIFPIRWWCC
jgi:hypothetical protein